MVAPELVELGHKIGLHVQENATWQKRSGPRLLECLFSVHPEDRSLVDACRQVMPACGALASHVLARVASHELACGQTLTESTDDMHALVDEYRVKYELDAKLHYTERRGVSTRATLSIV